MDAGCGLLRVYEPPSPGRGRQEHTAARLLPFEGTLILNVKRNFEPEAVVRIRITHSRGLGEPAGASEDQARAHLEERLRSLGVKRM